MGDLTKNLSRYEFECECGCGSNFVDFGLPPIIQGCINAFQARYPQYDVRVHINSGTRCHKHNEEVGGKSETKPMNGSKHLYGMASDFYLYDKITGKHINDDEVAEYLESKYPDSCGIGRYIGRTHIDNRQVKARWDKRF